MATSGHPFSSSCRLPTMSSRARTTVASLLMWLAVLAGSCATTTSAQGNGGGAGNAGGGGRASFGAAAGGAADAGFGVRAGFNFGSGANGGGSVTALGLGDGPPKVEVEPVKVTVDNRLDCTLRVVLTAAALGSQKSVFVAPRKFGSIQLPPASSPKLTMQVLPDKEEYVIVGNAASRGVALTGPLSIVVVKSCKSPIGAPGLLLEVTNELKLKKETICAEADGSHP